MLVKIMKHGCYLQEELERFIKGRELIVMGRILDQGRYTRISKGLGIVNQDCVRSINDNTQRSRCRDVGSV